VAVAVPGASSLSVTTGWKVPSSRYVCEPLTVKTPPEPETEPAEVVPSPQSMLAVKSAARGLKVL
jgi:hypothetical protein